MPTAFFQIGHLEERPWLYSLQASLALDFCPMPHCVGPVSQGQPCVPTETLGRPLGRPWLHPVTMYTCDLGFGNKSSEKPWLGCLPHLAGVGDRGEERAVSGERLMRTEKLPQEGQRS